MWHRVDTVVQDHNLDPNAVEVLFEDIHARDRFGIVNEFGWDEISTWHVNDFVAEVRKQMEPTNAEGDS